MENRFDELAKAVAGGMSRREALRRVGGGLVGAVLASLGLGTKAWSAPAPNSGCEQFCRDCGISPGNGNAFGQCVSSCEHCWNTGGKTCTGLCPTAARPNVVCCPDDQVCCPNRRTGSSVCCGPGLVCDQADRGCVSRPCG
jgi:hypothetical protein